MSLFLECDYIPALNKHLYLYICLNIYIRWVLLKRPTTNPPITDYLHTNPPIHRPPKYRPTKPIITDPTDKVRFKWLENRKISILQNTKTARNIKKLYFDLLFIWWSNILITLNACKRKQLVKRIVYKKTDEWFIERQQVTTSGTTGDSEWFNE